VIAGNANMIAEAIFEEGEEMMVKCDFLLQWDCEMVYIPQVVTCCVKLVVDPSE
jgi:hypothetical protein